MVHTTYIMLFKGAQIVSLQKTHSRRSQNQRVAHFEYVWYEKKSSPYQKGSIRNQNSWHSDTKQGPSRQVEQDRIEQDKRKGEKKVSYSFSTVGYLIFNGCRQLRVLEY